MKSNQSGFRQMVEARLEREHLDLFEKRRDELGDPMMQTALWSIMDTRDAQKKAENAQKANEAFELIRTDKNLVLLRRAKSILNWFDPWSDELHQVTGETKPNRGGLIAGDQWEALSDRFFELSEGADKDNFPNFTEVVSKEAARILGGDRPDLDGEILDASTGAPLYVKLLFTSFTDFEKCFPVGSETQVADREDNRAWAAVGLCDNGLGLALFASQDLQQEGCPIEINLEPVKDDAAQQLRTLSIEDK